MMPFNRLITLAFTISAVLVAPVAQAATKVTETWSVTGAAAPCVLVVTLPIGGKGNGKVVAKPSCRGMLKNVDTIAYVGGNKRRIVFQNKAGGGQTLATLKRRKSGLVGSRADGSKLKMTLLSTTTVTISVTSNISTGSVNSSGGIDAGRNCVRYISNRRCAITQDLNNPNIPSFQTITMKALADMKVYPFSGGNGFAKSESVTKGSTRKVKRCEQAFNSVEMWCEIVLSDGFFTGWIKRQDADFVYLRR